MGNMEAGRGEEMRSEKEIAKKIFEELDKIIWLNPVESDSKKFKLVMFQSEFKKIKAKFLRDDKNEKRTYSNR